MAREAARSSSSSNAKSRQAIRGNHNWARLPSLGPHRGRDLEICHARQEILSIVSEADPEDATTAQIMPGVPSEGVAENTRWSNKQQPTARAGRQWSTWARQPGSSQADGQQQIQPQADARLHSSDSKTSLTCLCRLLLPLQMVGLGLSSQIWKGDSAVSDVAAAGCRVRTLCLLVASNCPSRKRTQPAGSAGGGERG